MSRTSALVLAAPLLLVAACAKEADHAEGAVEVRTGAAAVSALQAAPDAVADAGTSRFEMVMAFDATGQAYEVTATGAYDADARRTEMTMDMGSALQALGATGGGSVPEGFDDPWRVVVDGETAYLQLPMLATLTGTDGWVSMGPDDLGMGADLGIGAGAYDPSKLLESLRGVGGEPTVVGEEAVRGVDTTHYRVEVDLDEALANVPEAQRDTVEASLDQLGDLEGAAIPVDVWIDDDGLPRRVQLDLSTALGAIAGDGTMQMTMELFDYGEAVDIEVPPADEVTPFREVMGGLGGTDLGS